jgi:predicted Zn-dependent protease
MLLDRFDSVDARRLDDVPADATLRERYRQLFLDIRALQTAPVIEPYVGPAILDGRAAGVFFHEVFGHRIEGHRQDAENEGQTFASMVGQPIMDTDLDVYDDPNIERLNGVDLNGFYAFDDEGVPAERANLVQAGILRGFLMSRTPARGFLKSNGHGRREAGHSVVARQANLVVDPIRTVSRATLEQALLSEVSEQGLPYGLRFAEISGGFTQTQRYDTQAFKVIPVMVYRLYPDGRQELVRGVDIEGTPLTALSKIELAANDFEVFNGVCGAESGWVPVSATSPSLLLSQIEVARQEQSNDKPPLLPPPSPAKGDRP